jgi:hypothetical protein
MIVAFMVLPTFASAQVCPYGNGGGSSSGGGGATLLTITVDGNSADWGPVLANAGQVTFDGEWANCATSTDKDYVTNPGPPRTCASRSITGRDLAQFAWTFDGTNVYLYVKRFGSSANTQNFLFYMDTNSNQRMNTGEKVYVVSLSGTNRRTDGILYNYVAVDGTNGDPLVAPAGSTYPGYADGYTIIGTLTGGTTVYSNVTGGFSDGTGFEARVPWATIGVPAATPIFFHVSSTNNQLPQGAPSGIDDNLGGVNGQVGAFAFRLVSVTPDNASAVSPGNPATADYTHTVTNTGNLADRYDLTAFSSLGLRVDLYDDAASTLMATDLNGDGDFADAGEYCNPSYDSNADGRPNTPLLGFNPAGTFVVRVRLTIPAGVNNVTDTTILSAFSQTESGLCASATDTTTIGDLTLTPSPQAKSVVAGQTVDYGLTLGNNSVSDTFDLRPLSSLGWAVQIYTDPNGDGDPADGVLVATDLNGNGVYTDAGDSITAGYDTNANNRPDFGVVPNTQTRSFVVRLTAPGGATVGTVDTSTVLAQGAVFGKSDTAVLTTTVRLRLTFTPSYTTAAGTNKYSGQGRSVFYAHTLINSWPSADSVTLSATSNPAGWTVRYWTDPDGDGNPGDGVQITAPFALAANGGTLTLVVEVVIPSGLALPLTHTAVVTATGAGSAPTVTDQVRVSYVATFADPAFSISRNVFALCQTIYAMGSSLTPGATYTIRYINPPPSSAVIRSLTTTSDGNGDVYDSYTLLPSDARGTWTIELRNASNVLVDSAPVLVDPPPANPSTVSPLVTGKAGYAVSGDNLSIIATFNNTSTGATYAGTTHTYLVRNESLSQYLRSDGTFASYTGTETTRTTGPHTLPPSSSATETVTVNGVVFPAPGIYRIDVSWTGSCGFTIATATLLFPVGTTLASYSDAGHTVPDDYFRGLEWVYLHGAYYLPSTTYTVAYYRPDGTFIGARSRTSTAGGELSDSEITGGSGPDGTWHVVVYPATATPPPIYNPSDPSAVSQDSFILDTVPPAAPSVTAQITSDQTPTVTGTLGAPLAGGEVFTVTVNGVTYTAGDGNLTVSGTTWSLIIPPGDALGYGSYSVTATVTDQAGNSASDPTADELVIDTDGDGIPPSIDIDDDNDAILDAVEGDGAVDTDGDGVPDSLDLDSDNDGINDLVESGLLLSSVSVVDLNGDGQIDLTQPVGANGLADAIETVPGSGLPDYDNNGTADLPADTDGDGRYDFRDLDSDNDGVNDVVEGGESDANGDGMIDGTPDQVTGQVPGSDNAVPDTDGTGLPDYRDADSDGDGVNDIVESGQGYLDGNNDGVIDSAVDGDGDGIPDVADGNDGAFGDARDSDNDGIPDATDLDDDNDGILDTVEGDGTVDTDGDGVPDSLDLDSDNDGINDLVESGLNFAELALLDANGDGRIDYTVAVGTNGLADLIETVPGSGLADYDNNGTADLPADTDGDGWYDFRDLDSDNDGVNDVVEGGETDANGDGFIDGAPDLVTGQVPGSDNAVPDTDGTGFPDYRDTDSDGDGINDIVESGQGYLDGNNDGVIDGAADADGDGIPNVADGNDGVFGDARDNDNDGIPDATDLDDDNDGILDAVEGSGTVDTDGDGVPDSLDLDSDNDGINDLVESGLNFAELALLDANGDGRIDHTVAVGANGLADAVETVPGSGLPDYDSNGTADLPADTDGDGRYDFRDLDSDNDGINDVMEGGEPDANGDGLIDGVPDPVTGQVPGSDNAVADGDGDGLADYRDLDSDGDGIPDIREAGKDALDGDGDGDIDDPADGDGDGLPSVIDGSPAVWGDAVSGIPNLLRNDDTTSLAGYDPAAVFTKAYPLPAGATSLQERGGNLYPDELEGGMISAPGSGDDDDHYLYRVINSFVDAADAGVLTDAGRPLVFYELSCSSCTLYLTKDSGFIRFTYTP